MATGEKPAWRLRATIKASALQGVSWILGFQGLLWQPLSGGRAVAVFPGTS